ncbi:MAG: chorismate-binding protein [Streptococcus salivarius]
MAGAPKIATMEIIKKVEKAASRGVYCGAIGISWCHRDLVFSTWPFGRTTNGRNQRLIYGVRRRYYLGRQLGSAEYEETKQKAALFYAVRDPRF